MQTEKIREKFNHFVLSELAQELSMDVEDIDVNADVLEYGVDSIAISTVASAIEKEYGLQLNAKVFFQSEDLEELLNSLWEKDKDKILMHNN